jgi:hypothetical protein
MDYFKWEKVEKPSGKYLVVAKYMHGDADMYTEKTWDFDDEEDLVGYIELFGRLDDLFSASRYEDRVDYSELVEVTEVHRDTLADWAYDMFPKDDMYDIRPARLESIMIYKTVNGEQYVAKEQIRDEELWTTKMKAFLASSI